MSAHLPRFVRVLAVAAIAASTLTVASEGPAAAEPVPGFEEPQRVADLETAPIDGMWQDDSPVVVGDYVFLFEETEFDVPDSTRLWEYHVPTGAFRQVDLSEFATVSTPGVAYFTDLVFAAQRDLGGGNTEPVLVKLTPGGVPAVVKVLPIRADDLAAGSAAVYFSANSEALWESDLTDAGTVELATGLSQISDIVATQRGDGTEILYFQADGPNGQEPHRYDPGVGVTEFDIATGSADSAPEGFHTVFNAAYFRARDTAGVRSLYRLAGTDATLVTPELLQADVDQVIGSGTRVFTAFDNGAGGTELAYYDDTADTLVTVVADFPFVTDGFSFGPSGALLGVNPDVGESAVWFTDGTTLGTIEVRDGAPLSLPFSQLVGARDAANAAALFVADDGTGERLWRYTPAPSLTPLDNTPFAADFEPSDIQFFASAAADQWVFPAGDEEFGYEPFNSNGTTATTSVIADAAPGNSGSGPQDLTAHEGGLDLLVNRRSTVNPNEFATVDSVGVLSLVDLGLEDDDRIIEFFREPGGSFLLLVDRGTDDYFVRSSGGVATELGMFDEDYRNPLILSGDRVFFERSGFPTDRIASVKVDGTDLQELGELGFEGAIPFADGVVFESDRSVPGDAEPWFTDGTLAGTQALDDIGPSRGSFPAPFFEFDGAVYFHALNSPYVTDGTPGGTAATWSGLGINEIGAVGDDGVLVRDGSELFFVTSAAGDVETISSPAYPNAPALQFWQPYSTTSHAVTAVLDGGVTWIGVVDGDQYRATEFALGPSDRIDAGVAHRGVAFYVVDRDGVRKELWRTDGTAGGTAKIWEQRTSPDSFDQLVLSGDFVYFAGWTEATGKELWTIDIRPEAPTGVTATAGDASATVSWTAPTDPGSLPISGYTVVASPGGATCSTTGATSCAIGGLANGTAYTFTVTTTSEASVSAPSAPSAPVTPMAPPPPFDDVETVVPARLLDTRDTGETVDDRFEKVGRLAPGDQVELEVLGRGGVAADASAVVLNVTMIRPDGNGFVTISPCGERPNASSMNAPSSLGVVANEVVAKVSPAGTVCLYSSTGTHLAADVTGYVPAPSPLVSLEPGRLLDTRDDRDTVDDQFAGVGRLDAGGQVELEVLGRGGVPSSGVSAVILNVTMIRPDGNGFVTISPCGDRPNASSMNAPSGRGVVANEVIAKVSAAGTVCLYSSVGTHLAADVVGYVPTGSGLTSLEPGRLLDTRDDRDTVDARFAGVGRLVAGEEIELEVLGRGGVPGSGVGAVVLNVTMIRPDGNGFITGYPCGTRPLASSLNAPAGGGVAANELIAQVSSAGTVCLYASVGTHLAADVTGFVAK